MGTKESSTEIGQKLRFECYKQKKPERCQLLGRYLDISNEFEKAGMVFKQNCEQNRFGKSCFQYAEYLTSGKGGVVKNEEEALSKFEESCQLDYLPGCHNVGVVYVTSEAKNIEKGMEHFDLACSKGLVPSCETLMDFYMQGYESIEKDICKAFTYANRLCDLGHARGCVNLGVFYKKGDAGVEKNIEMAEKCFAKAKKLTKGPAEKSNRNVE